MNRIVRACLTEIRGTDHCPAPCNAVLVCYAFGIKCCGIFSGDCLIRRYAGDNRGFALNAGSVADADISGQRIVCGFIAFSVAVSVQKGMLIYSRFAHGFPGKFKCVFEGIAVENVRPEIIGKRDRTLRDKIGRFSGRGSGDDNAFFIGRWRKGGEKTAGFTCVVNDNDLLGDILLCSVCP